MTQVRIVTQKRLEEILGTGAAACIDEVVYLATRYESTKVNSTCEGVWYIPFNLYQYKIKLLQIPTGVTISEYLKYCKQMEQT